MLLKETMNHNDKEYKFINNTPAGTLYYNPQYNVYFAPFSFSEGNFWFTVYRKQPRLVKARGALTEGAFIEAYAKPAYRSWSMILYTILGLLVPNLILILLHIGKENYGSPYIYVFLVYVFLVALETWFLWTVNPEPVWSRKRRKVICP